MASAARPAAKPESGASGKVKMTIAAKNPVPFAARICQPRIGRSGTAPELAEIGDSPRTRVNLPPRLLDHP